MARPTTLPGEAGSQVAAEKFAEAADPAPVTPAAPQETVPDGAPPVLTLDDVIPTIPLPEQAVGKIGGEEFAGPEALDDLFGDFF